MNVISVGCVCVDVFIDKKQVASGGESLNFCGNICVFPNVRCSLMSVIGNDEYGRSILEQISRYPINTQMLSIRNGSTANHKINHTEDGDRYFKENAWEGGVYDEYVLNSTELEYICSADVVHTTVDSPVFKQVIECKKKSDFCLAVDFNEYRDFNAWCDFLPYVDLFFISGEESIFNELKALSEEYKCIFVCTLAEKGSIAFVDQMEYRCSAEKVNKVVDTTGAGDSFQAGFVNEYYNSKNIERSLSEGSKCAAKNICRIGGF